GVGVAGEAAERGNHAVEPEAEEPGERRLLRSGDLEHDDATAWTHHAPHLGEAAAEIGEVARAEADRRGGELPVGIGKLERAALVEADLGRLLAGQLEHAFGEVEADDPAVAAYAAAQLDRQVAGS